MAKKKKRNVSPAYAKLEQYYGRDFANFCRASFPKIMEDGEAIIDILEPIYGNNNPVLMEDIENNMDGDFFRNCVMSIYSKKTGQYKSPDEILLEEQGNTGVTKSPAELLAEHGYTLHECRTVEEVQQFEKYYEPNELLCTFKDIPGRLKRCAVYWITKDGMITGEDAIKRSDKPEREDDYGTSVMSIQFDKKTGGINIITRYNHTVLNPNSTYHNDPDLIDGGIPGLRRSFEKTILQDYGIKSTPVKNPEKFLRAHTALSGSYLSLGDGKVYRYTSHFDNVYIGVDGTILRIDGAKPLLSIPGTVTVHKRYDIEDLPDKDNPNVLYADGYKFDKEKKTVDFIVPEAEITPLDTFVTELRDNIDDITIEDEKVIKRKSNGSIIYRTDGDGIPVHSDGAQVIMGKDGKPQQLMRRVGGKEVPVYRPMKAVGEDGKETIVRDENGDIVYDTSQPVYKYSSYEPEIGETGNKLVKIYKKPTKEEEEQRKLLEEQWAPHKKALIKQIQAESKKPKDQKDIKKIASLKEQLAKINSKIQPQKKEPIIIKIGPGNRIIGYEYNGKEPIPDYYLQFAPDLSEVSIPNVKQIGNYVFDSAHKIESLDITSCESIGQSFCSESYIDALYAPNLKSVRKRFFL